jgi:hypothetical protein
MAETPLSPISPEDRPDPAVAAPPAATAPAGGAEPLIATTLEVPPLPGAEAGEGGEFDLLLRKLRAWLEAANLPERWQKLRGPLKGLALLLVLLLALRLYARLVGAIGSIPLVSGLLELTGLLYFLWFSSTHLARASDRQQVFADWQRRWQAFSGRD